MTEKEVHTRLRQRKEMNIIDSKQQPIKSYSTVLS